MNTGIQDMINLGWKLAFVLQGKADPKLLDTYNDDRFPVIENVLSKTEGLTDAIGSGERCLPLGVQPHRSVDRGDGGGAGEQYGADEPSSR